MRFRSEKAVTARGWSRWIRPIPKGYHMACCDCALVHTIEFRVIQGRVHFRVRRNNRATCALRKSQRIIVRTK